MDKFLLLPKIDQEINPSDIGNKLSDFDILKSLGKGGFGFVAKVKSKKNHKIYAMKMIDLNKIKDQNEKNLTLNEIQLIKGLDNPHIIKYYNYFVDNNSNKLYLIMDHMSNGDLKDYISVHVELGQPIPEDEIIELFYQCASGLCYCHRKNIVHRDIKPQNLFMTETKEVKIGDFGIAFQRKKGEINTLYTGTPKFMAPEMFEKKPYDAKIDVYALGVTFHALCYFRLPRDVAIVKDALGQRIVIQDMDPSQFQNFNYYSNEIKTLIYKMIDRNPTTRLNSEQVLNDIKAIYNKKNKPNGSIGCAYNCLYCFKNLTLYIEKEAPIITQFLVQKPITNSFNYFLTNTTVQNQEEILNNLRDILTYNNSSFPDPGQLDPNDILRYIIKQMHLENTSGNKTDINIIGNNIQNYLQNLQLNKSCILDFFFGTLQINKFCNCCKQTDTCFTNFFELTFDIDQALKIGIASNSSLENYFINQNKMIINTQGICKLCNQPVYFSESKMIFSLPYNLVISFKGEKNNYNNQYIRYNLKLNLAQLGLASSPKEYELKGIIKCVINEEQKNYVCIYLDPKTNNWMFTNGYTRQKMPNPTMHNQGDVVALIYFSSEKI